MATPHISGVAAYIYSLYPKADNNYVRKVIKASAGSNKVTNAQLVAQNVYNEHHTDTKFNITINNKTSIKIEDLSLLDYSTSKEIYKFGDIATNEPTSFNIDESLKIKLPEQFRYLTNGNKFLVFNDGQSNKDGCSTTKCSLTITYQKVENSNTRFYGHLSDSTES